VPHQTWPQPGIDEVLTSLVLGHQQEVFQHRHAFEFTRNLKGTHQLACEDAVRTQTVNTFALEQDASGVGTVVTGNHVEQGGLAGTVWTDQAGDGAATDGHGAVIDRHQTAKTLDHLLDRKNDAGVPVVRHAHPCVVSRQ
jgi:hypothetical protein